MKIGVASDHRGYKVKQKLIKYLLKKKYEVIDYGTNSTEIVDYPDFGIRLGEELIKNKFDYGIGICANGVGMSIACNKVNGIRCAKTNNVKEVISARKEDDINIVAISADLFFFEIKDIIDAFIKTSFSTIERYDRRVKKLLDYENKR